MEANPYKFDAKNPRLVTNAEPSSLIYAAAGTLFLVSVSLYSKKIFRVDGNFANFAAFAIASGPASYAYANFAINDPVTEAAQLNNDRELQKI